MASPPVLLVHGFASSFERNWREPGWVDLLADAGRVVVPLDLPGHGTSAKPHDPSAYADLAGAVEAALPPDGAVDAVGFSLGAGLLLAAAARQPGRFRRIVVAGIGGGILLPDRPERTEALARAVERGVAEEGDPPAAAAFARFGLADGNDALALAACLRRPAAPLDRSALAGLDRPVLVVIGDRDFAAPAEPLVDALPDARLVTIRGLDHFATPRDYRFVDAALGFLEDD